ncbi:pimeloyl-ACP methyl ester carboxylesterase [Actinoplanes lutulentus]|uniref:Pimeloyl-ACP methyl ester carboxylesterase n=1 Tax=Actinoplanes lutulentus TaxID=1287878 RepID=A0A327ZKG5_9ACTN|nr:alpha/beta hydrolase [Actinoplanes lutulentus]MBB2944032.1 pimeloyl-ACP methyl ester carboxylesterase [Actinoplanes lutulentus]RAK42735.1 pimeloyl-ACP methyl ester carboxylesterase [Actinoplanes lutulentus]
MKWLIPLLPAVVWGAISAWWTPRGPLTSIEAVVTIAASFAAGTLAARSRWAFLTAPLLYALTVELVRIRVSGPSVDAPHPSPFGAIALVTGRGVHGVLALFPMFLGALLPRRGRVFAAVALPVLVLLAVTVAIPGRTAGIPGGVAELTRVDGLNLMIRGADRALPVLLFVPGTPGGSEMGAMRKHLSGLEQRFVVATMDRRAFPPADVTVDDEVADVLTVTDYLRSRFGQSKIYLVAFSGGSIPGVLAVEREPSRFAAYIGTGQAVDLRASDQIFYADILAWARAGGRADVVAQLEGSGPPPYADFWGYEPFLLYENQAYDQGEPAFELGASEYSPLRKAHTLTAIMDTWDALYPRMQDVDLRRDVPRLGVPAYFVQGGAEMRGLSELFTPWYEALLAPSKQVEFYPGAGHRAIFEDPQRFVATMSRIAGEVMPA